MQFASFKKKDNGLTGYVWRAFMNLMPIFIEVLKAVICVRKQKLNRWMHEAMNLVTKKKTSNFSSHFRVEIRRNSKNHNDHNQYDPYNLRIFHKRFHPEDEQTLKFKTTG